MSLEQGTVSDTQSSPQSFILACLFFELVLPHLIPLSNPLHTYMVLHLLHTLMPALDSRFSGTAKNLSLALGGSEAVSPHRQTGPLILGKYGLLIFLGIISTR